MTAPSDDQALAFADRLVPELNGSPIGITLGLPHRTRAGFPVNLIKWTSPQQLSELTRARKRHIATVVILESGAPGSALALLNGSWNEGHLLYAPTIAVLLDSELQPPKVWDLDGPDLVLRLTAGNGAAPPTACDAHAASIEELADLVDEILAVLSVGSMSPARSDDRPNVELSSLVPFEIDAEYSMDAVLRKIVDGGQIVELHRPDAAELITAFANFRGRPIALIASRPDHDHGRLRTPAIHRLNRFFKVVDELQVPLVSFADSVGIEWEPEADTLEVLLNVISTLYFLKAPKCVVLAGNAFGPAAALLGVMGARSDYVAAWPRGRVAAEGVLQSETDPRVVAESQAWSMAREGVVLDLVHPDETFRMLSDVLEIVGAN